jgi:hypothetical protein
MQPDTEPDPPLLRDFLVRDRDLFLDRDSTLDRIDGAGELREDAVAGRVGDAPAVLGDEPVRQFPMGVQEAKRSGLVGVHQPAVAGDVRAQDGREAPLDNRGRLAQIATASNHDPGAPRGGRSAPSRP